MTKKRLTHTIVGWMFRNKTKEFYLRMSLSAVGCYCDKWLKNILTKSQWIRKYFTNVSNANGFCGNWWLFSELESTGIAAVTANNRMTWLTNVIERYSMNTIHALIKTIELFSTGSSPQRLLNESVCNHIFAVEIVRHNERILSFLGNSVVHKHKIKFKN